MSGRTDDLAAREAAKKFLAALDEERWRDAARYLHPETAEAFKAQQIELIRISETWPPVPPDHDVQFVLPAEMLGVEGADEAEGLTGFDLFARWAQSGGPNASHEPGDPSLSLRRTIVSIELEGYSAFVRHRTALFQGGTPLPNHPCWNDVRTLRLSRYGEYWRVQDVDLGGADARLLLTEAQINQLRDG